METDITEDLAWIAGIIAGDGHIQVDTKHRIWRVIIAFDSKKERNLLQKVFDTLRKMGLSPKVKEWSKGTVVILINSKFFTEFLISVGIPFGKKSDKVTIPSKIFSNERLAKCFIRGLFDADGCVVNRKRKHEKRIELFSKSRKLIEQLSIFLSNLGINNSVRFVKRDKGFIISISKENSRQLFMKEIGLSNEKLLKNL